MGFSAKHENMGLRSVALLLVQLYACTNVGTHSLHVLFGFSGNVPSILIKVVLNTHTVHLFGDGNPMF